MYVDLLCLAAFLLSTMYINYAVVTLDWYICLGKWAELMRWMLTIWSCWAMKSCYYNYSQYLSFYKDVERTALICNDF